MGTSKKNMKIEYYEIETEIPDSNQLNILLVLWEFAW